MSIKLSRTDLFNNSRNFILASEVFPNKAKNFHPDQSFIHPLAMSDSLKSSQEITSSLSFITRVFFGSLPQGIPLSGAHPYQTIFGVTSLYGMIQGIFDAKIAGFRKERAALIGNSLASNEAAEDQLRASLNAGSGGCFFVHKIVKTIAMVGLGPARILLPVISALDYVASSLLIGCLYYQGIRTKEESIEITNLKTNLENKDGSFEYIYNLLNPKSYNKDQALVNEGLFYGRELLKQLFLDVNKTPLKDEEYDTLLLNIFGADRLGLEALAFRNHQKLERLCGKELLAKVKPGLSQTQKDLIVEEVKEKLTHKNSLKKGIYYLIGLAISLLCIGFVVTNPIGSLVVGTLLAVIELPQMYWSMQTLLKNGPLLPTDRKFLKAGIGLAIASLATTIALTVAFSFPIAPLILATVMTMGWICSHAVVLLRGKEYQSAPKNRFSGLERQNIHLMLSHYVQKHIDSGNGRRHYRIPLLPHHRKGA